MYMRNRLNNQVVTEVREHFGELAYDTIIQRNIRLGEAPSHGKPVMLYDAGASARRTISRWPGNSSSATANRENNIPK